MSEVLHEYLKSSMVQINILKGRIRDLHERKKYKYEELSTLKRTRQSYIDESKKSVGRYHTGANYGFNRAWMWGGTGSKKKTTALYDRDYERKQRAYERSREIKVDMDLCYSEITRIKDLIHSLKFEMNDLYEQRNRVKEELFGERE